MPTRRTLASLAALILVAACDPAPSDSDSGPPPDGECNAVVQMGTPTPEIPGPGTMPAPAGGVITDGTYVLTSFEIYPPGSIDAYQRTDTFVFAGDTIEAIMERNDRAPVRRTGTWSTSGTTWTLNQACPMTQSIQFEYTATPTTFSIFEISADTNEVHTYTKL